MLEQILDHIHNYFVSTTHYGKFSVVGGSLQVDFLQNGQYFKIVGSILNDGVYQYPTSDLTDEEFDGQVWALAIPKALITLSNEVEEWMNKNKDVVMSPFTSESFGGYSYTKANGSSQSGSSGVSWQDVFKNQLNAYRKIS